MTFVGFAGLLIALSAAYFADIRGSRIRFVVFALLFVLHTLASVAYYFFVEASGGDAAFYYYDDLGWYGRATGLGTAVIINTVQYTKERLGGTFFDYFMLFQATGFWGLVILEKTFQEIHEELGVTPSAVTYLPLFLPGLHFWTAGVGKDGPVFLGVALSLWAMIRLSRRLPALGLALSIMILVRPHIAVLSLMALGLAALVDRATKAWIKGALVVGIIAGAAVVGSNIQATLHLDTADAESVGDYMAAVAARGTVDESSGANQGLVASGLPVKVLSLWFRPFFVDAENLMGYIASLENLALLMIMLVILARQRLIRKSFMRVLYVRYALALFVTTTLLLGAVNYNVGLGLRQKMMAMPCLLVLLATLLAIRAAQKVRAGETGGLPPARTSPPAYSGG